jgi:hypothetical protein
MTDTPEESAATKAAHGNLFPNVTSLLALAVSIFALAIGAWQTRLMQSQARASVWPHLSIGYTYNSRVDENGFIWNVDNNGVGPARIENVTVTLDRKPMKNWHEVLAALGFREEIRTSTTSFSGDVIPPSLNRETAIAAIRVNQAEAAAAFKAAVDRFTIDVCYCSVYDDCWVAHWSMPKVDPVARCEAAKETLFDG